MPVFKCKMCGGALEINNNETVAVCEYCGTKQTLPKLDNERKLNLYDRANHFRRNDEFDKAMGIYEQILNEDNTDAESYWSIVLCRYGIEYVEDPASHKRISTVNRAQFTSIYDDEDYKSALQYADGYQREVYESEANAINEIQKGILAISQKEEPFDVFICYKETDHQGRRTQDSVLAQELYYELLEVGFKVFFSRITLEDKLGQEYEPYIFAALNSAKVMVVLGTKPEHFNAVWVKNEWSRYLALIKKGADKMLIPAYRDMDPYDLPEEFSHLQAQDMSKLGFMQDLVRGISKIADSEEPQLIIEEKTAVNQGNATTASLMERAFIFLEDGDWISADEYCEKVLDAEPRNAMAYLGKLMAEMHVRKQEKLAELMVSFEENGNYQKALKYSDIQLKNLLENCVKSTKYNEAIQIMNSAKSSQEYWKAFQLFEALRDYKNATNLVETSRENALKQQEIERKRGIYETAIQTMNKRYNTERNPEKFEEVARMFDSIAGWKDAKQMAQKCRDRIEFIKEQEQLQRENEVHMQYNKRLLLITYVIQIVVGILVLSILFAIHETEEWFLSAIVMSIASLPYCAPTIVCQTLAFGSDKQFFLWASRILGVVGLVLVLEAMGTLAVLGRIYSTDRIQLYIGLVYFVPFVTLFMKKSLKSTHYNTHYNIVLHEKK